ncbi:MAG: YIP1 family protein [Candidatus Hydrogenedentota bacterium]
MILLELQCFSEEAYMDTIDKVFPWEDPSLDIWQRCIETIKGVLFQPASTFAKISPQTGIGKSLLFAVIFGTIGNVFATIYQLVLQSFSMLGPFFGTRPDIKESVLGFIAMPIVLVLFIIISPLLVMVGVFIWAGIYHLFLLLFRAAEGGFEATIKVVAYTMGSTMLFNIVPFCGCIIAGIWSLVCYIIGFKVVHSTDTSKAVFAVLLPLIIVCCCCIAVIMMIAGMGAFAGFTAYQGQGF